MALPVRLEVSEGRRAEVRDWLESVLGWQVVDEATARLVPAVMAIADTSCVVAPVLPTVLLVPDAATGADAAAAAIRVGALASISWPADRGQLAGLAGLGSAGRADLQVPVLRVGGAGGGVGTTTVAAGVAALLAWSGRRTLLLDAAGRGGVESVETAPRLWEAARAVAGVERLRSLAVAGSPEQLDAASGAQAAVLDAGSAEDVDVLVVVRDHRGLGCLGSTTAAAVVVRDEGPVPLGRVVAAAAGRRVVVVPTSGRVARAHLRQRVPADLPGSYLRRLATVLAGRELSTGQRGGAITDPR